MNNWIKRNLKNIIVAAFIIPILLVAFVSISHVTSFYGISNPWSWALYLSVGIEIAALSALAAVSVKMGRFIYIPFLIVTLIQMIGNVFFSFSYIDETSEIFKDWISMVGGIFENMGVETTDISAHKFILSFLTGGLLPIISLTFAHMLVKYSEQNSTEEDKVKEKVEEINVDEYEKLTSEYIEQKRKQDDELRYKPTQEEIKNFEKVLNSPNYNQQEFNNSNLKQERHNDSENKNIVDYRNSQLKSNNNKQEYSETEKTNQVVTESKSLNNYNNNTTTDTNEKQKELETKIVEDISQESDIQLENLSSHNNQEKTSEVLIEIKKEVNEIINDLGYENIEDYKKTYTKIPFSDEIQKYSIEKVDSEIIKEVEQINTEEILSEVDTESETEIQEITPNPITEKEKYKVLNYFKQ